MIFQKKKKTVQEIIYRCLYFQKHFSNNLPNAEFHNFKIEQNRNASEMLSKGVKEELYFRHLWSDTF